MAARIAAPQANNSERSSAGSRAASPPAAVAGFAAAPRELASAAWATFSEAGEGEALAFAALPFAAVRQNVGVASERSYLAAGVQLPHQSPRLFAPLPPNPAPQLDRG